MNYRLEFNEKKQKFHLDRYTHEENTHGWVTIFEHCTDLEFRIYESYVNRVYKKKLTIAYLLKCAFELKGFYKNLMLYGLFIENSKKTNNPK
jgi:hypothetical protein